MSSFGDSQKASLQKQSGLACVDVDAGEVVLRAAPEVAQVLLRVPEALKSSTQGSNGADTEQAPDAVEAEKVLETDKVEKGQSKMRKRAEEYFQSVQTKADQLHNVNDITGS